MKVQKIIFLVNSLNAVWLVFQVSVVGWSVFQINFFKNKILSGTQSRWEIPLST